MDLEKLFRPSSIAVIGASRDPNKVGGVILRNLKQTFKGPIYPVNPNADEIQGLKCYKSVRELKGKVDLAVIAVPAPIVLQVLKDCNYAGVKFVIIISAGFKEIGEKGAKLEEQIKQYISRTNMHVVGPNCMGIIDLNTPYNATFVETSGQLKRGRISFISQSGALLSAVVDIASDKQIKFSKIISVGNAMDIDEADVLDYLAEDPETGAIFLYLEGVTNGRKLLKSLEHASRRKPVFVLKGGKSDKGSEAVKSHTGSIAGSYLAYQLAFKKAGVSELESVDDMFNLMRDITIYSFKNKDVVIITNSGGAGVITADKIRAEGLELAKIDEKLKDKLSKILPEESNKNNPIDVLGDATPERYEKVLDLLLPLKLPTIVIFSPQEMSDPIGTARVILAKQKEYRAPVFAVFLGGSKLSSAMNILIENNIPTYTFPEEAVDVIKAISTSYSKEFSEEIKIKPISIKISDFGIKALKVFESLGFTVPKYAEVKSLDKVAKYIGFPLVLKVNTPEIPHKSKEGLVKVGINSIEEMKKAIAEFQKILKKKGVKTYKIEAYEDINKIDEDKMEILLGVHKDPQFGSILIIGLGGTITNIINETFPILYPLTRKDLKDFENSKIGRAIAAFSSEETLKKIEEYIKKVLAISIGSDIADIDLNPIVLTPSGKLILLDAKIYGR